MRGDPMSTAWREPLEQWGDHEYLAAADARIAAGDWRGAEQLLLQAREHLPDDLIVQIGLSQAKVAAGNAWTAVAELERLYASNPDHPVVRRYLAAFLLAAADQSRSMTRDELLVVASERQLAACEGAGFRILDLGEPEFEAQARHLVQLVAAGRVWMWRDRQMSTVHLIAVMAAGLAVVVVGGAARSIPLVVAGIVLGAALIGWLVLAGRRQAWRGSARQAAGTIWRHGLPD